MSSSRPDRHDPVPAREAWERAADEQADLLLEEMREAPSVPPPRVPALWAALQLSDEAAAADGVKDALEAADRVARQAWRSREPQCAPRWREEDPETWESWRDADRGRARVAAALSRAHAMDVMEDGVTDSGIPRAAVTGMLITDGSSDSYELCTMWGRGLRHDWTADPQHSAGRMARCSVGYAITGAPGAQGAEWSSSPIPCGHHHICPLCGRRHSWQEAEKWGPVLTELRKQGQQLVHMTFTIRSTESQLSMLPVIITEREWNAGYRPPRGCRRAKPGEQGVSAGGEPLGWGLDVLRTAKRTMTSSTRNRARWARLVAGHIGGLEWTGHRKIGQPSRNGFQLKSLRWHAHMHILAVVDGDLAVPTYEEVGPDGVVRHYAVHPSDKEAMAKAGVTPEECGWWGDIVDMWTDAVEQAGGTAEWTGQKARMVAVGEEDVEKAVREVVKYPFKPGEMTTAQIAESVTTIKGSNLRIRQGHFHASSRAYQDAAIVDEVWRSADAPPASVDEVRSALDRMLLGQAVTEEELARRHDLARLAIRPAWYLERVRARSASLRVRRELDDEAPTRGRVYRREGALRGCSRAPRTRVEEVQALQDLPPIRVEVPVRDAYELTDDRPPGPVVGWVVMTEQDVVDLEWTGRRDIEVAWYDVDTASMVHVQLVQVDDLAKGMRTPKKRKGGHDEEHFIDDDSGGDPIRGQVVDRPPRGRPPREGPAAPLHALLDVGGP